jgi:hypothetical protein
MLSVLGVGDKQINVRSINQKLVARLETLQSRGKYKIDTKQVGGDDDEQRSKIPGNQQT